MRLYRLLSSLGVMAFLLLAALPVSAADSPATDDWQFVGEVYLWAAGIGGESAAGDDIDISFTDLAKNLDLGFMGFGGARKGRWGLAADIVYLDVSDDFRSTANLIGFPIKTKIDLELTGWVVNLTGGYTAIKTDKFELDVLAGARYLSLDADASVHIGPIRAPVSESGHVWDGIVGVRGKADLSDKWYLRYHLDAGTGDTDFTWQALAGFGYQFNKMDAVFGYRHLEWDFDDGDTFGATFDDLDFSGPYAGVKFLF